MASRLPKPSGLPRLEVAGFSRRRSKSFTDLTSIQREQKARPVLQPIQQNKPLKTVPQRTPAVRAPVKRSATDSSNNNASKAKMPKQAKIPDWDYKGRFNQLNERYAHLVESNRDMKEKLAALEHLQNLQAELDALKEDKSSLTIAKNQLTSANNTLQSDKENLEKDLKELTEQHKALKEIHKTINNLYEQLKLERDRMQQNNAQLKEKLELEEKFNTLQSAKVVKLKNDLMENNALRRNLHNTIQDLKGNIRVFCRVRPPNKNEDDQLQCRLNFIDESSMEIGKTRDSVSITGKPQDVKAEFKFDKVFAPESTQSEVFEELAHLVQSALDGYNVCVFAYGQTGSGKTYTMQGIPEDPNCSGMIPRSIDLIFNTIKGLEDCGWVYSIKASFLEIYNEAIRDLLDIKSDKTFDIRFNEGKGTTVTNMTIQSIKSAMELKKYMSVSQRNRMVAATDFNEHSSRSHAVTKIYLEGKHLESNINYAGSISLVDLAGSESAKTSNIDRIQETKSINKSLSNLGTVMMALHNRDNHVPYRNSKLTYLLQSSLGGNSKTLMFVNISPFDECYMESINSLRFASKVKEVKLAIKRNKN